MSQTLSIDALSALLVKRLVTRHLNWSKASGFFVKDLYSSSTLI